MSLNSDPSKQALERIFSRKIKKTQQYTGNSNSISKTPWYDFR